MIHTAIFDLDGTLIDTPKAIVSMMSATMRDMGVDAPAEADIRAMIGLPLEAGISKFLKLPLDHPDVEECKTRYKALFHEWLVPRAADLVFPGVAEGLNTLAKDGVSLGVATSKHQSSAEAILRSAGLWDFFDHVAGADDVTHPKPHPEMALLVMSRLGGAPETSVVVGDTRHDLKMAIAAGMQSIAVTYGIDDETALREASATWIAPDFSRVTQIIHTEIEKSAA